MRIAVCDDEKEQIRGNTDLIRKWADRNKLNVTIDSFASAEEFLFRWSEGHPYDLAVFDIKMKNMTGMELAKIIRKKDRELPIVFITGVIEQVFEGYEVAALNYLVKPYKPALFYHTLDKAYEIFQRKEGGTLLISHEGRKVKIPFYEIMYMEIKGHYIYIYTSGLGDFQTKKRMDDMLSLLDGALFIRCHRSYIVNISHAARLDRQEIKLKKGQSIPISQPNLQAVTQFFLDYHYRYNRV